MKHIEAPSAPFGFFHVARAALLACSLEREAEVSRAAFSEEVGSLWHTSGYPRGDELKRGSMVIKRADVCVCAE